VRSIEGRDASTREHSERVAALCGQLAVRAGWSREQALALSQAALLHDVGRIASGLARADFRLHDSGLAQLRSAAALSARVVEPVLTAEQAQWIGEQFSPGSDGAGMMALADAWDTLTAMAPGLPSPVLADLCSQSGSVFSPTAVRALVELYEAGELRDGLGETPRGAR
jgi:HD-GYP domain-containing protein (c-di-GMP phosphodiesterase class II)